MQIKRSRYCTLTSKSQEKYNDKLTWKFQVRFIYNMNKNPNAKIKDTQIIIGSWTPNCMKGAKRGGEHTLALNERDKIPGSCNSCNWNFGLGFLQGMV